jgi:quinohemoprotein ethanol dehydrogenase
MGYSPPTVRPTAKNFGSSTPERESWPAPVIYAVGGVQYLTLMVGWGGAAGIINPPGAGPTKPGFRRVLTFAIGGAAKLDDPRFGHQGPPSPAIRINATPATVHEGDVVFAKYCLYCHGVNAIAGSGIPDLRYASAETYHQFESIVLAGARESRGMPSFKDVLKRQQLRAIQAYILSRAAAAANTPGQH